MRPAPGDHRSHVNHPDQSMWNSAPMVHGKSTEGGNQRRLGVALRWLGAVGITLAPLGLFVLPGLLHPEPYETAEDQFGAMAEGSGGGGYLALGLQLFGSALLVPAARNRRIHDRKGPGRALGGSAWPPESSPQSALLVALRIELSLRVVLIRRPTPTQIVAQMIEPLDDAGVRCPAARRPHRLFPDPAAPRAPRCGTAGVVPIIVPLLFAAARLDRQECRCRSARPCSRAC